MTLIHANKVPQKDSGVKSVGITEGNTQIAIKLAK